MNLQAISLFYISCTGFFSLVNGGRCGRDRMGVVFHHWCEYEPGSWRGVFDTTLCDKVCKWLATGWWFSPGTPVSSTNKTVRHNITEILLITITLTLYEFNLAIHEIYFVIPWSPKQTIKKTLRICLLSASWIHAVLYCSTS